MISPSSLLLTAVIVGLVVGTRRLRNIGEDLGAAVNSFRRGLQGEEKKSAIENESSSHNESNQ